MAKKKGLKWWQWVLIALGVVVTLGSVSALFKADEEKTLSVFSYERAAVEAGKVYESDASIVSDYFSVNEMVVDIDSDAKITYQIHFYDEDKEYVSSTEELSEDFTYEHAEGSTKVYARIEITPTKDDEISWTEKFEYAKQLTVTYNPELIEVEDAEAA